MVVESRLTPIGHITTIGNPVYRDRVNGTSPSVSVTESSRVQIVPSTKVAMINGQGPKPHQRGTVLQSSMKKQKHSSSSRTGNRSSFTRSGSTRSSKRGHRTSSSSQRGGSKGKPFAQDLNGSSSWNGSVSSMTPSQLSSATNGGSSITDSVSTISTVVSSIPRGPLRSSLKKSKTTPDGFGIKNPGFAGSSPTLSRTGSLKKVRIQTHSTDV